MGRGRPGRRRKNERAAETRAQTEAAARHDECDDDVDHHYGRLRGGRQQFDLSSPEAGGKCPGRAFGTGNNAIPIE